MDETDDIIQTHESPPKIPKSFQFKKVFPLVATTAGKEVVESVDVMMESTVLVPNKSPSSTASITNEKIIENEINLLNNNNTEKQDKPTQTKKGMDMFISKVSFCIVMYCIVSYCTSF